MVECDRIDNPAGSIRQGDVLAAHPNTPNWASRWKRFYVVISADCDIEHQKTEVGLVVVPIIGLKTFLSDMWLPAQFDRLRATAADRLATNLNRFSGKRMALDLIIGMSSSDLKTMLDERSGADKDLGDVVEKVMKLHEGVLQLDELRKYSSDDRQRQIKDCLEKLCLVKGGLSGSSVGEFNSEVHHPKQ